MPYSRTLGLGVACLAFIAFMLVPGPATAATTTANVRVVTTSGPTLADQSQVTGDVSIKTDPNAKCFGGSGGSGNDVNVPGPTALGIVKDAADSNPALRPLSVTDQFGFALGVCGIGGFTFTPSTTATWYLKVNHRNPQLGGDQVFLTAGDDVLWYLAPDYNSFPNELELVAPPIAQSGRPFTVRVFSYDDAGQRSPAIGARVSGADQATGSDGTTTVLLGASQELQAVHDPDIPSNREIVCLLSSQSTCGLLRHRIIGTNKRDRIRGTNEPDLVRARAGEDRINIRGGLPDVVNCGRGADTAIIGFNDVARRCEKVIRKG